VKLKFDEEMAIELLDALQIHAQIQQKIMQTSPVIGEIEEAKRHIRLALNMSVEIRCQLDSHANAKPTRREEIETLRREIADLRREVKAFTGRFQRRG
jgi:hypothetical protein